MVAVRRAALARIDALEAALTQERCLRVQAQADRDAALTRAATVENAMFWRITAPLRRLASRMPASRRGALRRAVGLARRTLANPLLIVSLWRRHTLHALETSYPKWSAYFDTPDRAALARIAASGPLAVHILIRFDSASAALAPRTFAALKALVGVTWSGTIVFDRSCSPNDVRRVRRAAGGSPKFDIAPALPAAHPDMPMLFVQGGALLRPHGAWAFLEALRRARGALAYADEDVVNGSGVRADPWFKPRMARLLIEQDAILGRVVALRPDAELLAALADPEADARSVLRAYALGLADREIVQVPHVLFRNALPLPDPRPLPAPPPLAGDPPLVSVIIPTRDLWNLLGPCLDSVLTSRWPSERLDVIVVDNGSTDPETLEGLAAAERGGRIRIVTDPAPFNFSRLINAGAQAAKGQVLVLLNNDMEVLDPDWIAKLVGWAMHPDVGAVGAKLLYPDRTVQHAGVVCGLLGAAGHAFVGLPGHAGGYFNLAGLSREILAMTGACIAVRRSTFEAVGGLREDFCVSFNDVAFCIDLHARGLRNIMLADPLLIHYESKSRGADDTPQKKAVAHREAKLCWARYAPILRDDPSYSPNLSLQDSHQRAAAPRRRALWTAPRTASLTVMVMSETFSRDGARASVIESQVKALQRAGHRVILLGPVGLKDLQLPGCQRLHAYDPRSGAMLAVGEEVDLVINHTPRFYPAARWLGAFAPVIACDYGEAVGDPVATPEALAERSLCLAMSHSVLAVCPGQPQVAALLAEVERLYPAA